MVLFPEGGFLRKRREVSQRYAEKNNLPTLKNVTLPRVGALKAITEVLPPRNTIGNNNAATKRNGTSRNFNSQGEYSLPCNSFLSISISLVMSLELFFFCFLCFVLRFSEQIQQYQNKKDDENHEPHLDYVLDITIAYPEGEPIDLPTIVTGTRPSCQTHFLYRLYHSSEVRFSICIH